ncbi:MAG: RNA-binding protein [Pseudomonadota bacterium]
MDLFIGNLSPSASLGELIAFFKGFSSKARFHLKQKKLEDGSTVRYAIAEFDSDKYAIKMIRKFHGEEFRGHSLIIREYLHRSYTNERRAVNWREKPWQAGERRNLDRRHKEAGQAKDDFEDILATSTSKEETLDEKAAHLKVQAYDNFARKS